jgi:hypothetical protein
MRLGGIYLKPDVGKAFSSIVHPDNILGKGLYQDSSMVVIYSKGLY